MNTIESTVAMMRTLPEADLLKIQDFTKKLSQRREIEAADEAVGRFLKPMSREDFYRDLEISRKQASEGEYREAGEFLAELRAEYGI